MIDNFEVIDNFLEFEEGYFYKFEALVRNTDGENALYYEGISNTNKNILIKNWFIDTKEYYDRIKSQMITLCDLTGARLYVTLDKKSNDKLVYSLFEKVCEMIKGLASGTKYGTKKINRLVSSCSSLIEVSNKSSRTIMFDIDIKNEIVLDLIKRYIKRRNVESFVLNTRSGYHVFCFKKFNTEGWKKEVMDIFMNNPYILDKDKEAHYEEIADALRATNLVDNQLGLVYHPEKNNV